MLLGFNVYACLAKHSDTVRALAASERLTPDEVAVRLVEEAIAAPEKKKRQEGLSRAAEDA
ncbi:hypothetical protein [Corallococcus interemptor]|uniref:hypothetical protein n=1 Tax=Corallococcus interemptor TaxID=2316720 RepID=UPI0013158E93|nr:hypothetical protein [Corallococcus interemptor]